MKYEQKITRLAGAYYTDEQHVIYAYLVAGGITPATAYYHAFRHTMAAQTREELTQAANTALTLPYVKDLINVLQAAKKVPIIADNTTTSDARKKDGRRETKKEEENTTHTEERRKVLQNIEDVRVALAAIAGDVSGKDKAAVLVQLAKMLPDEEKPDEERTRLYLPFSSDCRFCALFQDARKKDNSI